MQNIAATTSVVHKLFDHRVPAGILLQSLRAPFQKFSVLNLLRGA